MRYAVCSAKLSQYEYIRENNYVNPLLTQNIKELMGKIKSSKSYQSL